jgi:hypothetical protein
MTSMNASASAVSRMLKADGLTITPRYYRFGGVSVDEATEILTAHGYTVQRSSWNIAYASKGA